MKVQHLLTLLLISFSFSKTFAQQINVTFKNDPEEKILSNYINNEVLSEDKEFTYVRIPTKQDRIITLAKIEKSSGQTIWQKQLPIPALSTKEIIRFIALERTEKGFSAFFSKFDKKAKELQLTGQSLDENLNIIDGPVILSRNKSRPKSDPLFIIYYVVKRGNRLLFYDKDFLVYDRGERNIPITFTLVDKNLTVIWNKSILTVKDMLVEIKNVGFDNDGNLFALIDAFTLIYKTNSTTKSSQFLALKYDPKTDQIVTSEVMLDNKFKYYYEPDITFDTLGSQMLITGSYHSTMPGKSEGVFHWAFDYKTMKTRYFNLTPFPKDMIAKLIGAKETLKGELPPHLEVSSTKTDALDNTVAVLTNLSEKIVIVLKTDVNGAILWSNVLPFGYRDIMPSKYDRIKVLTSNSHTYLLFNAHKKYADATDNTMRYISPANEESSLVILGYENKTGKMVVNYSTSYNENPKRVCNLNNIVKITDNTYLLRFDELNGQYSPKNSVTATLNIR